MIFTWKFGVKNFLTVATIACTGISANAQSKQAPESSFLNPKKAPVVLELNADKEQVRNRSSKEIVSFTLGCVTLAKSNPTKVMVLAESKSNLAPGQTFGDFGEADDLQKSLSDVCRAQGSKVAVVEVVFADGKRWSILKTRPWIIPFVIVVEAQRERTNTDG